MFRSLRKTQRVKQMFSMNTQNSTNPCSSRMVAKNTTRKNHSRKTRAGHEAVLSIQTKNSVLFCFIIQEQFVFLNKKTPKIQSVSLLKNSHNLLNHTQNSLTGKNYLQNPINCKVKLLHIY